MVEITTKPQLPAALISAASIGSLVPFIGAGVSMLAGCPSWQELADAALKSFVEKGVLNLSQLEQLKSLRPRVKLSLALSMADKHGPIDFRELLHPKTIDLALGRQIYGYLSRFSKVFVTTNYDTWLDEEYPYPEPEVAPAGEINSGTLQSRKQIHRPDEFVYASLLEANTVIKLHGSLDQSSKMILTTRDYAEHYANDRGRKTPEEENRVLSFLNDLFDNQNVLFIGYSVDELEIIEYVIQKARGNKPIEKKPRHYILQGFFSHEKELAQAFADYFSGLGIQLIAYSRDEKDWKQLIEVMADFSKKMPIKPAADVHKVNAMKGLLK